MPTGPLIPDLPGESSASAARTLPMSQDTVVEIGSRLGVVFQVLAGSIPGREAWQAFVDGGDGRPAVSLTVWPKQRRVDAVAASVTAVLSEVVAVRIGPGDEVTFVRADRSELVVRRGGRVVVRC